MFYNYYLYLSMRPLMICLLPPRCPHCLEEEVANDEEDDKDIDAVDNDDGDKDMPPKAKPDAAAAATAAKK